MRQEEQSVFGLFFEVRPKPGQRQAYFDHVEQLKPILAGHDGLLWMQRYQSIDQAALILSHQYWAGEAALAKWRRNQNHRYAQIQGMKHIFADYRIRVGPRIWHWDGTAKFDDLPHGDPPIDPPVDQPVGKPVSQSDRAFILTLHMAADANIPPLAPSLDITGHFHALADEKSTLIMAVCSDLSAALGQSIKQSGAHRAALFAPTRDYGLFDRDAAPLAR